jgi:putative transcriptional regulator
MATHLAPDEMLAGYACGATTPGIALLIAAHLTQAPEARRRVRAFERVGGALMAGEAPAALSETALERTLAALDHASVPDAAPRGTAPDCGPLPRPVAERVGLDFDRIPWKLRLPGVSTYEPGGFGDDRVVLLRARPGASVPQHTHRGLEVTLVMQGCMLDRGVEYVAGDVIATDEQDDHRPRILGDETCYCLIVQQGELHFTGPISRFLNLLGG